MSQCPLAWGEAVSQRIVVIVMSAAFLLNPTAWAIAAEPEYPPYGKYVCVTDRVVGMQTEKDNGERFAGQIKPTPTQQRFFVTIRKVLPYSGSRYEGWLSHSPRCFSDDEIKGLQRDWAEGFPIPRNSRFGDQFQEFCLTTTELQVDTGDGRPEAYYSTGRDIFRNSFLGGNRFWMYGTDFLWDRYVLSDVGGFSFYHLEGRCSLVTPQ
jgi:hypothetical protein